MAQNALTVTAANPTPPTNLIFVGNTAPLDPAQAAVDDGIAAAVPNSKLLTPVVISTINEAEGATWPIGNTFTTSTAAANTASAPGAGISNTHEARGTETSVTAASATPIALGQLKMVGVGPAVNTQALRDAGPNANHASSFSPTTPLTPTTIATPSGANNTANGLATVLTVPGTNFNRTSVVNIVGVPQNTNYVSTTSLTVTNAVKRTSAGTSAITVTNTNSGITSNATNWTMT